MKKWGIGLALSITIIALFVFCKGAITQESGHGPQLTIYKNEPDLILCKGGFFFSSGDIADYRPVGLIVYLF